ncbi:MAG TPA: hypothetical protein VK960_07095 [Acidimicrobiia bacterium]|nr:hypothetical protein [Acidimicrobiia bacterium]
MPALVRAETRVMECTRCGGNAAVKRADSFFCASCALNRDWREIIVLVQDARVETPVAGRQEPRAATA